ncbi:thiamine diphosphate-binding protein [Hygrophoropsis aurantiaca]|uniref:Thiamine diphosphate-binding protein n=1 Tax=Hygrophoropsis aurantiaca TaxID=72124 RepID=A0ACB8ADD6_9AGAM|nr:thiamine diphosphate-binding protein [Hygrophoropsis aurantiaca]
MTSTLTTDLQNEVHRLQQELHAIGTQIHHDDGSERITISEYLLTRLEQLGVTSVFGVPGDFNMPFLDYIEDNPNMEWVGNCNELNAAYAADGYARVKEHSVGVVVTTFGVGELSAINGIAGAFSEMVPVVHIVGVPSTVQLRTKPMLHHTLGDGRFNAYTTAAEQVTSAQTVLMHKATAAAEIDRVLSECITRARPVYVGIPTDMVGEKISTKGLKVPLSRTPPPNDPEVEKYVLERIDQLPGKSASKDKDIIILVDACAIRHDVRAELNELIGQTQFPVYATPMGKTAVSEKGERYGGIYIGSISDPGIKEKVENAALILSIGSLKSDFNTGMFTYSVPASRTIELHSNYTQVRHAQFPGIGMKQLLPKLTARLKRHRDTAAKMSVAQYKAILPKENEAEGNLKPETISHAFFWPRMEEFFGEKDIIVAETGTSSFGILDVPLPEQSVFVAQILYGSIGWSVGGTLGAALAARDKNMGRTIAFIGDGSFQLGVQEISTMIHNKVKPIIFILNNQGYNIERHLHGMDRQYHTDLYVWCVKWTSLLTTFGDAAGTESRSYTVRTKEELNSLLGDAEFARADKIQLVEVVMDKYDTPRGLRVSAELGEQIQRMQAKLAA